MSMTFSHTRLREAMKGLPTDVVVTFNYVKSLEYGLQKDAQGGVKALIGTPVVTVNQVMKGLHIAFPAANKALTQLQDLGIVEPLKDRKRNRTFALREAIELLNRPAQVDPY